MALPRDINSLDYVEVVFNASAKIEVALEDYGQSQSALQVHNTAFITNTTAGGGEEVYYPLLKQPTHMIFLYSLAYSIVFLAALVGNFMVVAVVVCNPSMHSVTNYFLLNLCVADVLVALFCVPVNLIMNLFNGWQLGAFMCKAAPYLQGVSVCASVNTLAAIALDRYFAICRTLEIKINKRKCKIILFFIWVTALGIMVPWLVYYRHGSFVSTRQHLYVCYEQWPSFPLQRGYYLGVIFVCCYTVPLAMIIICYLLIGLKVGRRHALGARNSSTDLVHKSKVKVIKMLCVVCVLFAFSWLPLYSLKFWQMIYPESEMHGSQIFTEIVFPLAQWLGSSNCCANPIIYCFFSKKFREGFRDMITCCSCWSKDARRRMRFNGSPENTIFKNGSPRYNGTSGTAIVTL